MFKDIDFCFTFLLLTVLITIFLTACQPPTLTPAVSPIPTATLSTLAAEGVESVSPVVTPSNIPTPSNEVATVYGTILDSNELALSNMPVYLGEFDGLLVEISLNRSPKTITDDYGNFVFTNISPNDDSFQYTVGIIWGNEQGMIIEDPESKKTFVFDVSAGEVINLGLLESDF